MRRLTDHDAQIGKWFTYGKVPNHYHRVRYTTYYDEWRKLDSELNLQTFFSHIGKVTNKEGLVLRKFIFLAARCHLGRIDQ